MGYASYLIYKELDNPDVDVKLPLALYGAQLATNWVWTPVFFGKHKIGLVRFSYFKEKFVQSNFQNKFCDIFLKIIMLSFWNFHDK